MQIAWLRLYMGDVTGQPCDWPSANGGTLRTYMIQLCQCKKKSVLWLNQIEQISNTQIVI